MKKLLSFISKSDSHPKDAGNTSGDIGGAIKDTIARDIYRTNQELDEMQQRTRERRVRNGKPTYHEIDL